jgi:hypothetical protein
MLVNKVQGYHGSLLSFRTGLVFFEDIFWVLSSKAFMYVSWLLFKHVFGKIMLFGHWCSSPQLCQNSDHRLYHSCLWRLTIRASYSAKDSPWGPLMSHPSPSMNIVCAHLLPRLSSSNSHCI